ncbi:MAG: IS3 family transposase [Chlamydiae bacterium]|nr:IS3 family transposase [Chlamydiota bacterium]
MKFEAIDSQRKQYPLEVLCRVLKVSRSGYYDWCKGLPKRNAQFNADQKLLRTIETIYFGSNKNYGSPTIADRVKGLGFDTSESTVARRMRKYGIRSRLKRKFKVTTTSNHKLPVAPNHLMQDFTAHRPDQIWMSDITYIDTKEGTLYICGIIDLFSKKIVGWHGMHRMPKELVISAYMRAKGSRKPDEHLIFHSDRGSQYASKEFSWLLKRHGAIQSMSRKGNCWDSAPIESFWARLKTECVYWEKFATRQEALAVIAEWISRYNEVRAHSSNNYATPCEVENMFAMASGKG